MMKYILAIIPSFILIVGLISSSGMATMKEDGEEKMKASHSPLVAHLSSPTAINTAESDQINISPLSFFTPQMKEALTVCIPFFQSTPSSHSNAEQRELSQQEVEYLFEHSSDFVMLVDADYIKKVNKHLCEATGWNIEELIEKPAGFFEYPDSRQKVIEYRKFVSNKFFTFGFESHTRCKDGSYIWIQWLTFATLTTALNAEEERPPYLVVGRDITQQKEQEAERLQILEDNKVESAFIPTDKGIERSGVKITGHLNNGRYELLTDITRKLAKKIAMQTGVKIPFESGEKIKKDFALGKGRFGKFMLARKIDVEPKQVVGVKQIKGESAIESSLKEGEIQVQFKHLNVMPLLDYIYYRSENTYGYEELEPALYQFMPLAGFGDGAFFQQKLALMKNTPLEDKREKVFGYVAEGLLKGLAYMHSLNFYHLDFKNTNFVIMRDGTSKIIDFGCTQKSIDPEKYNRGMGDTGYYSLQRLNFARFVSKIEHVEKAEFYSPAAADAWALGITLVEMWENAYPFDVVDGGLRCRTWGRQYFENKLASINSIQDAREGNLMDVVKKMLVLEDKGRLRIKEALQHSVFNNNTYDLGSEEERTKVFTELKALQRTEEIIAATPSLSNDILITF